MLQNVSKVARLVSKYLRMPL